MKIPEGSPPGPRSAAVRLEERAASGEWITVLRQGVPFPVPSFAYRRPYTLSRAPSAPYEDTGGKATDGLYADENEGDGFAWGYPLPGDGDRVEADLVLYLGAVRRIDTIRASARVAARRRPDHVTASFSTDGEAWSDDVEAAPLTPGYVSVRPAGREARYVRFHFAKTRKSPEEDWMLIDEVEVY